MLEELVVLVELAEIGVVMMNLTCQMALMILKEFN
jgi:hypothetical protein